jgi:hypothetical protein
MCCCILCSLIVSAKFVGMEFYIMWYNLDDYNAYERSIGHDNENFA